MKNISKRKETEEKEVRRAYRQEESDKKTFGGPKDP